MTKARVMKLVRRFKRQAAKWRTSSRVARTEHWDMRSAARYEGIARGIQWAAEDLERECQKKAT